MTLCTGVRGNQLFDRWGHTHSKYAKSVQADHVIFSGYPCNKDYPILDKYSVQKVLEVYDRCIYLDADIEVLDNAPNLFFEVPSDCLGVFDEQSYYPENIVNHAIDRVMEISVDYRMNFPRPTRYLNAGLIVTSKIHKNLFDLPTVPFLKHHCYDQDLLFARILHNKVKCKWMGSETQYISGFGNNSDDRYFKHYPGVIPYEK